MRGKEDSKMRIRNNDLAVEICNTLNNVPLLFIVKEKEEKEFNFLKE